MPQEPQHIEATQRTIEETYLIRLSADDQRRFVELLLDPPALAPALARAKRAHARLIRESR